MDSHDPLTTSSPAALPRTSGTRSRWPAHLMSPVLAIIPWVLTVWAVARLLAWVLPRPGQVQAGPVVTATALLLLAAAGWALLTAWSSVGTLVAGAGTLLLGWFAATATGQRAFFDLGLATRTLDRSETLREAWQPAQLLLLGSLLVAMSLAAAGARRLGRYRPTDRDVARRPSHEERSSPLRR